MDDTIRPAQPGELCTCGRQATLVYPTHDYGDVGHCGKDGGGQDPVLPCPWCGATLAHMTWGITVRCPNYTLRPEREESKETPEAPPEAP